MRENPFVTDFAPGRTHLSLRTLAANDNVPLAATAPPRHVAGNATTLWPIVAKVAGRWAEKLATDLKHGARLAALRATTMGG